MSDIKFTQKMTMHLNGGSKFSKLVFEILADGKKTNICRSRTTNGSPRYLITEDVFVCGDKEFDVMATKGVGLIDWLNERMKEATGNVSS